MKFCRKYRVSCIMGIVLALYFILDTFYILPAYAAQTSSPSASIISKLEELKKEIASKAASLKQEVNQKLQNKAYVGVIKTKSSGSITLAAKSGSKIVNTNQDTVYIGTVLPKQGDKKTTKKTPVTLDLLKEEDNIAALGDIDETGVLTAKEIILLPPDASTQKPKAHIWGEVISISNRLLAVKDKDGKSNGVIVAADGKVRLGNDDRIFADIQKGDFIIASGTLDKDGVLQTGFVYIIPDASKPKPTASPEVSSSPSASPSKTPKPSATKKPTPSSSDDQGN